MTAGAEATFAAIVNGPNWTGRHRAAPPMFAGRPLPMADADAPLPPPLAQLADSAEAPAPAEPAPTVAGSLSAVRDSLMAAVAVLEKLDKLAPLSADEWDGGE